MTLAESMVKLGLGKDKHRPSKSEERGVCEKNHKEYDDDDGNGVNNGNGKPLQKCPKKSIIEGGNGPDKEPKKLGLSKGKVKANRAKMSKKKRVKCFLCRGPHENYGTVQSNPREKVVLKVVKFGPMKLNLSKATKLAELSTRLSPMEEVSWVNEFRRRSRDANIEAWINKAHFC
ncbi:hypothetical protein J1N35_044073 [Gossypium stocksii]|uniref:Uncharacterized protein n=1 Tax=Gossypium stocksii TaxID=47602 RepID=A0A9D3U8J4_9ROSI|nr:hypothetical protein J1N35_044073 [Gossypium stocksii]